MGLCHRAFYALSFLLPLSATAGVIIDHPLIRVADGVDVTFSAATLPVESLRLTRCSGAVEYVSVEAVLDLLTDELVLPPGSWCALRLITDGPLHIEVQNLQGQVFYANVVVDEIPIALSGAISPLPQGPSAQVEIAAPGWIDASDLGNNPWIVPGSPLYLQMRDAVLLDSALLD